MRTTLDLDKPVLDGLKRLQKERKETMSRLASSLLAESLARLEQGVKAETPPRLEWTRRSLRARVDVDDKEALNRVLDAPRPE
ncbi:MAG: hypothetical protein ACFE0O_09080 [Opitutales bacterium]